MDFVALVGLALVDSLSMGTLVIPIGLLLLWGGMCVRPFAIYLGTVTGVYFLLGVALLLGLRVVFEQIATVNEEQWFAWIKLILGIALAAFGILAPKPKRQDKGESASRKQLSAKTSAVAMVGLGLSAALMEAATMLPYLAAMAIVQDMEVSLAVQLIIVFVYCLVMIVPILVVAAVVMVVGSGNSPKLQRFADRMEHESKVTLLWFVAILGVWLAFSSIGQLGIGG